MKPLWAEMCSVIPNIIRKGLNWNYSVPVNRNELWHSLPDKMDNLPSLIIFVFNYPQLKQKHINNGSEGRIVY